MTELTRHRIVSIEPSVVRSVLARPIGRNAMRDGHGDGRELPVVIVRTDRGATGWGHAGTGGVARLAGLDHVDALLGRSLADLLDPARGVIDDAARVLDIPLHDLAGRVLGMPVYAMLGASGSTEVRCYSGGIYFDDLDPAGAPSGLDAIRRDLRMDWVLGHRDFKLKIGRGHRWMPAAAGLERDIAATRLARELYPDARLLVDGNDGMTRRDIERYLASVADLGLYWVEELLPESRSTSAWLRALVDATSPGTRIADGEAEPDPVLLTELARDGHLDVALMDAFRFGFTAWRGVMGTLSAAGTEASPHTWGSPLTMHYAAHLAAGLGNVPTIEAMPAALDGVDASGYRLLDGVLSVPETPGFGIELSR